MNAVRNPLPKYLMRTSYLPTMLRLIVLATAITLIKAALGETSFASSPVSRKDTPVRRWNKAATADDKLWSDAVCRGGQFVTAFGGTDEAAGKIFGSKATPPTMRSRWQGDQKSA